MNVRMTMDFWYDYISKRPQLDKNKRVTQEEKNHALEAEILEYDIVNKTILVKIYSPFGLAPSWEDDLIKELFYNKEFKEF